MTQGSETVVYALKAWTIRRKGDSTFIAPTNDPGAAPRKAYASLQSACAAVARKLAEEWLERDRRRQTNYRKDAVR